MNSDEKLVMMANQIARNLKDAAATAEHIRAFWTPAMRKALRDRLLSGGEGLSDIARAAAEAL